MEHQENFRSQLFLQIITVIVDRCENARLVQLGEELVEDESNCKITGKIRGTN